MKQKLIDFIGLVVAILLIVIWRVTEKKDKYAH